jgi:beta-glucosidase
MKMRQLISTFLIAITLGLASNICSAQGYDSNTPKVKPTFQWPEGKKMGLSLSFDDARLSQPDKGIPLLDKYGVKGTFYVSPGSMKQRLEGWKKAAKNGHDIGNHSIVHPCTGNFDWSRGTALEDYTLAKMYTELDSASKIIKKDLGVEPTSFAYPCGMTFVGRGENIKSYIPVVGSLFESGRLWLSEGPNDPLYCDMSQLTGMESDGKTFEQIKQIIETAKTTGKWLILAGHEMNEGGNQTTLLPTLEAICKYAQDPANGIWIDNVHNIAAYVKAKRGEAPFASKMPDYKKSFLPVEQRVKDLLGRMTLKEKVGQMNIPCCYESQIGSGLGSHAGFLWDDPSKANRDKQLAGCYKWAEGTHNDVFGPGGGFFTLSDRLIYEGPKRQAEVMNDLQKVAIEKTRLGIPLLEVEEGTHGMMCPGGTIFPEGLAIGATWNKDLVKRIYTTAAREGRSIGLHGLCTLCVEPNRDPRMGRNEEGYSEDPYMCSMIAINIVQALQGNDISAPDKLMAVLCHYPSQSQPVSGFERGAMEISERKFREVFLPSFKAGIKNSYGAYGVMATYPAIDGVAVHSSEFILTKVLREELGFKGIVLSEGGGLGTIVTERHAATQKEAGVLAIKAGVDVGISIEDAYMNGLIENVNEGKIPIELVDRAVARILNLKFELGLFENPYVNVDKAVKTVHTDANRDLALETSREGIVLLKNEKNLLPLKKDIKSIAVIGPDADEPMNQIGDYFPHNIPQEIVSVLKGIKNKVPSAKVTYVKGCDIMGNKVNELEKAKAAAKAADIAIVVVGENGGKTNGEGHDMANLDLTGMQEELLKAVHSAGKPVVAVLINGRALTLRWTSENIPAIVEGWMPGEQGGNAIADVLFGDYNPCGKLPVTFPRHSGQYPFYYNHSITKEDANYIDMPGSPLYEFGFGLSYTKFEYSNLQMPKEIKNGADVEVSVDVKNTGSRKGAEVVQLYIDDIISSTSKPVKELKGYEKVMLDPGETKTVKLKLTPADLSLYDRNMNFVVEPGTFEVMIGSSSKDIKLKGNLEVKN